jgi:cyanate permease
MVVMLALLSLLLFLTYHCQNRKEEIEKERKKEKDRQGLYGKSKGSFLLLFV